MKIIYIILILFINSFAYAEKVEVEGVYRNTGDIAPNETCRLAKERAKLKALEKVTGQIISSEELEKYASEYLTHLLDNSKESKSDELVSLNNLVNLVNLSDEDKIKFIGFSDLKKNEFLIKKFKFMMILLSQEKMVDQNFYLN